MPAFTSLYVNGHPLHWKAKFTDTCSFSRTLDYVRRHRLFTTTHYDYMSLHPYGAFSPAVCFSRKEGTQIILNETNNISTAVSAINQTVSQYAIGRLKTQCSPNRMKIAFMLAEVSHAQLCESFPTEDQGRTEVMHFMSQTPRRWESSTGMAKGQQIPSSQPQRCSWRHLAQHTNCFPPNLMNTHQTWLWHPTLKLLGVKEP